MTTTNGVNTWAKAASTTIGLKSRSTAGSSKGGLVLQIGDTSDSYNQLRVSISDMHTKYVVLGVRHHFLRHVGVADGGLGVLDVLRHDAQVVGGVLQTVLGGAQGAADVNPPPLFIKSSLNPSEERNLAYECNRYRPENGRGNLVDGVPDHVNRVLRALLGADVDGIDAQGGNVHVAATPTWRRK